MPFFILRMTKYFGTMHHSLTSCLIHPVQTSRYQVQELRCCAMNPPTMLFWHSLASISWNPTWNLIFVIYPHPSYSTLKFQILTIKSMQISVKSSSIPVATGLTMSHKLQAKPTVYKTTSPNFLTYACCFGLRPWICWDCLVNVHQTFCQLAQCSV